MAKLTFKFEAELRKEEDGSYSWKSPVAQADIRCSPQDLDGAEVPANAKAFQSPQLDLTEADQAALFAITKGGQKVFQSVLDLHQAVAVIFKQRGAGRPKSINSLQIGFIQQLSSGGDKNNLKLSLGEIARWLNIPKDRLKKRVQRAGKVGTK